ncbi:MAG: response regulator, partial [Deltaproteobacteria bacterium]|nr:response regulator [Deltaproteobacteria bacterium]
MQDKLIKEENFYEDLFENGTAISAISDRNGRLIKINKKTMDLFFKENTPMEEIIGQNILSFIYKDDRDKVLNLWEESILEKKEINYPVRMVSKDDRIMHFLISGRPIIKDDEIVAFQYQAIDIVDQKIEEQNLLHSASTEMLGQLAGGFAHDFNNLLTVINGYSEIMLSTMDKSHPLYSKIFQICQAGTRASMLTQKILEFSRKHKAESRAIDINEELSNLEAMLKHLIKENIRLSIEKTPGLEKTRMDPLQFSKLLVNLVLNAKNAMTGGGEIAISTDALVVDGSNSDTYEDAAFGQYVLLAVKDNGTGMIDEVKNHIFDPFFSTQEKGKGIGLWMVNQIVKDAGGAIFVESMPDTGTTFKILFPFVKESPEHVEVSQKSAQESIIESKTILVVEDDDTVRDLVREILHQKGHNIITARNGGDALQLARQYEGHIDLLITDMVMRRIDGTMLAKKMQSILPDIKVMLMSGYGADVINREDIQDFAFLQKPFLPKELIHKVES